ncbi:MAG: acyl carrier protein [Rhodothermales bacterium]|nr:acyl carrier protein [Rhodothermales bacterium]
MNNNYADTIRDFVETQLLSGDVEVADEDDLLAAGMVDSMGMMWLIAHIEDQLSIRIPPEHVTIDNFRTIGCITNYLAKRAKESNGVT